MFTVKGVYMQARNYVNKYSKKSNKGFAVYSNINATEKWVEYQLDVYDMSNMLMHTDNFNEKVDLLDAIAVAERRRERMYNHPNFDFARATRLFRLVKNSPKVVA